MLYLVLFLVVLFGLNLAFLYFKFRESEGKLKSALIETQNKLREAELILTSLKHADSLHTTQVVQMQSFTAILDSLDAGVIVIGRDEMIEYVNSYARRQLGKSDTDAIRESYKILPLISAGKVSVAEAVGEALKGATKIIDQDVTFKSGTKTIPVVVRFSPVRGAAGDVVGVSLFFYDISATVDTKTQLQSSFSSFAHELRTPIAIIKTGVALVLENYTALGEEKIKKTLKSVYDRVIQLADLVNEVLSASRVEQGQVSVNKENFDLVSLTEQVVISLTPMARDKKLFLKHEKIALEEPKVVADKTKTQEILTNLVSNAIKYTYQGGVTVSHSQENNHLVTLVSDTGIGISPEQQSLLFRKFQQVGVGRTMGSGKSSGLGLFIAKQLATAMGGDVVLVKSEPNQGSEFKLTLPAVAL